MPKPTPVPLRRVIFRRMNEGQRPAAIAAALGLSARTVENLVRRFRRLGEAGIAPGYRAPAAPPHAYPEEVRRRALDCRREHPTWGAGLIRVALRQADPAVTWPAERTLRGWFKVAGLGPPASAPRRATAPRARATTPHECWQVDAAEKIPLADGSLACWLRVVDECSGAVLATAVFPPRLLVQGPPGGHPRRPPRGLRPLG